MLRTLVSRGLQSLLVLVLVSAITFFLINLAPGGPASIMRIDATPQQREALRVRLGLDQPVPLRYLSWLGKAASGDLGASLLTDEPVVQRIGQRLPNTLALAGLSLAISILCGVPLGVAAALRRSTPIDYAIGLLGVLGLSIPSFWLGVMLILLFSVSLQLLPSTGHLLLPTVVLSTSVLPYVVRFTRSALLEVLGQDYVRTARAKGLSHAVVVYQHALRNALIPVVSVLGTLVPRLVGGAVITEAVFGWPGMGRLAVEAAQGRDYPLVLGVTVVIAVVVVVAAFVVDLAYTWLDPRIRLAA